MSESRSDQESANYEGHQSNPESHLKADGTPDHRFKERVFGSNSAILTQIMSFNPLLMDMSRHGGGAHGNQVRVTSWTREMMILTRKFREDAFQAVSRKMNSPVLAR